MTLRYVGVTPASRDVYTEQTSMTDRVRTKCTCPRLWRNHAMPMPFLARRRRNARSTSMFIYEQQWIRGYWEGGGRDLYEELRTVTGTDTMAQCKVVGRPLHRTAATSENVSESYDCYECSITSFRNHILLCRKIHRLSKTEHYNSLA